MYFVSFVPAFCPQCPRRRKSIRGSCKICQSKYNFSRNLEPRRNGRVVEGGGLETLIGGFC